MHNYLYNSNVFKKKKDSLDHGVISFNFQAPMLGGGGAKNCPKKCNIDYFGYVANLEVKFKLNFDEQRGSKIEKKSKFQNKSGKKLT